jgi:hypothetical protein
MWYFRCAPKPHRLSKTLYPKKMKLIYLTLLLTLSCVSHKSDDSFPREVFFYENNLPVLSIAFETKENKNYSLFKFYGKNISLMKNRLQRNHLLDIQNHYQKNKIKGKGFECLYDKIPKEEDFLSGEERVYFLRVFIDTRATDYEIYLVKQVGKKSINLNFQTFSESSQFKGKPKG